MCAQSRSASPTKARIIAVDDEEGMATISQRILAAQGYEVEAFTDPLKAIAAITTNPPDLVLTDMRMPGATGMEVLEAARRARVDMPVIIVTGFGTIEAATEAMRKGAFDFLTKPWNMDELTFKVATALEQRASAAAATTTSSATGDAKTPLIVGESRPIHELLELIEKVAPTDAAVLISGESGTGKELVARAVHNNSPRAAKRFVAINCASIPEALLESELFGHERGAFTGADRQKTGLVETAHQGTLFLDEIGEMPLLLQSKLLRLLQEREIQRVGGVQTIPVDIRVIAATNRNLLKAVEAKEFRLDLYFRLNVINLELPPLRDRHGDVSVLARYFLEAYRIRMNKPNVEISPEAVALLERCAFPGNVRELENVIQRMIVMCNGRIEPSDVPTDLMANPAKPRLQTPEFASGMEYKEAKDHFERQYLLQVIEQSKGNVSEAARISGISRRHFYEKLEKLNIKVER